MLEAASLRMGEARRRYLRRDHPLSLKYRNELSLLANKSVCFNELNLN